MKVNFVLHNFSHHLVYREANSSVKKALEHDNFVFTRLGSRVLPTQPDKLWVFKITHPLKNLQVTVVDSWHPNLHITGVSGSKLAFILVCLFLKSRDTPNDLSLI